MNIMNYVILIVVCLLALTVYIAFGLAAYFIRTHKEISDEDRKERTEILNKFMSKNFSDYVQHSSGEGQVIQPQSDFEEWKRQMVAAGYPLDDGQKEPNPSDIHE